MAVTTTIAENKRIVRGFPEEVISERNIDLIDELSPEDVIDHAQFGETRGREAIKETTEYLHSAFADTSATVEGVVAEGDRVAIRWTARGTHEGEFMGVEPTGRSYDIGVRMFARMEDEKITERWVPGDTLGIPQQLGIEPAATESL